ncbi:hypothetical protein L226DRAFT_569449 [Lentinus tigrinus ALCF2SS1-7]|uniref:uncharacterized protein n=1 Tax=Lentinus tigrinus ALCF2SS1-7 TaxID=1328758 RepID=UPI0011662A64|nr:hypothetical protein L226DRAFT_569449 [Lentinus tigrinus ALCF2SS1-7]
MPLTSFNIISHGFVATGDIAELSLGEPAYNSKIRRPPHGPDCGMAELVQLQFTDPFSCDFSRSPQNSLSTHDSLDPGPRCLSFSDHFLEFTNEASSQKPLVNVESHATCV